MATFSLEDIQKMQPTAGEKLLLATFRADAMQPPGVLRQSPPLRQTPQAKRTQRNQPVSSGILHPFVNHHRAEAEVVVRGRDRELHVKEVSNANEPRSFEITDRVGAKIGITVTARTEDAVEIHAKAWVLLMRANNQARLGRRASRRTKPKADGGSSNKAGAGGGSARAASSTDLSEAAGLLGFFAANSKDSDERMTRTAVAAAPITETDHDLDVVADTDGDGRINYSFEEFMKLVPTHAAGAGAGSAPAASPSDRSEAAGLLPDKRMTRTAGGAAPSLEADHDLKKEAMDLLSLGYPSPTKPVDSDQVWDPDTLTKKDFVSGDLPEPGAFRLADKAVDKLLEEWAPIVGYEQCLTIVMACGTFERAKAMLTKINEQWNS